MENDANRYDSSFPQHNSSNMGTNLDPRTMYNYNYPMAGSELQHHQPAHHQHHSHQPHNTDMYQKGPELGYDQYRNTNPQVTHSYNFESDKDAKSFNDQHEPTSAGKKDEGQRKRTRASADQLAILEEAFVYNSSPNSRTREILAEKVSMSERSVQIWFQNRRAKVKLMQKRNYMLQEEAMKHQMLSTGYLNNQLPFSSNMPVNTSSSFGYPMHMFPQDNMSVNPGSMPLMPINNLIKNPTRSLSMGSVHTSYPKSNDMKNGIMGRIRCDCLSIGSWRRKTVQQDDLVCFYNLSQRLLTWQVTDKNMRFKMEIPFSAIVNIRLNPSSNPQTNQAEAVFDTNQVPSFFMEAEFQNQIVWTPCRDFTENTQATRFFKHNLMGDFKLLQMDIQELANKDINLRNVTFLPDESSMLSGIPNIPANLIGWNNLDNPNALEDTSTSQNLIGSDEDEDCTKPKYKNMPNLSN